MCNAAGHKLIYIQPAILSSRHWIHNFSMRRCDYPGVLFNIQSNCPFRTKAADRTEQGLEKSSTRLAGSVGIFLSRNSTPPLVENEAFAMVIMSENMIGLDQIV